MSKRDPRIDPRPGDVLGDGTYQCEVKRVSINMVQVVDGLGDFTQTRTEWQKWASEPTVFVIHAAPETEQP